MNGKVLILGVASPQADAINYCKNMGLEVHACANSEDGLSIAKPHRFSLIDIKDADAIYEYSRDNRIGLIYSVGSDVALPTISYASEKLGLPYFTDLSIVNLCFNKDQLRSFLGRGFNGNIRYLSVSSEDETDAWNIFPCVVKPVDSQGQRGFGVCFNREQLKKQIKHSLPYSPTNKIIIEEFIPGPEISANLYLRDGRISFFQTTDRIVFKHYPGIVKEHLIPSRVTDHKIESQISQLCQNIIQKIGIKNGPLYVQLKLKDGEPKLIELTPRLDGCHLWQLINRFCGVNLLEATFRHLLNLNFNLTRNDTFSRYALIYITEKPGAVIQKKKYPNLNASSIQWYYDEGDRVNRVNGCRERVAHYIEKG